jgi:hypothetical protein
MGADPSHEVSHRRKRPPGYDPVAGFGPVPNLLHRIDVASTPLRFAMRSRPGTAIAPCRVDETTTLQTRTTSPGGPGGPSVSSGQRSRAGAVDAGPVASRVRHGRRRVFQRRSGGFRVESASAERPRPFRDDQPRRRQPARSAALGVSCRVPRAVCGRGEGALVEAHLYGTRTSATEAVRRRGREAAGGRGLVRHRLH